MELMYLLDLQFFASKTGDDEDDLDYGDPIDPDADNEDVDEDDIVDVDEDEEEETDEDDDSDDDLEEEKESQKEPKTETKKEEEKKVEEVKPKPQNRDVNHEEAEKRRQAKEKAEREAAEREKYLAGFKAALGGVNPFTGEKIETEDDVLEAQLMLKAKAEGKDPIQDYHLMVKQHQKEQREAEIQAKTEAQKKQEFMANDFASFSKDHPDVNLQQLFNDADFKEFAEDLVGTLPLNTIYAKYQKVVNKIAQTKEEKVDMAEARKESSVGNLNSGGSTTDVVYTTEQLKKMSPSDIKKHWKEIQKSYH